jgi:ABC-type oligopeptide transport system substrate-binding subunit
LKVQEDAQGQASFNSGQYEISASGWNTSLTQPEGYISALMRRDLKKWPKFSAAHPEFEQLAQKVEQTASIEDRRRALQDLQKTVFDVVPHANLTWIYKYNLIWDDLKNFMGAPGINLYNNYWDIWLDH